MKSLSIARWSLVFTVLGVIVAVVAIWITTTGGSGGQNAQINGNGNSVNQNSGACDQVSGNSTCVAQLNQVVQQAQAASANDDEFRQTLAKSATSAPTGPGPWPFVVVDTLEPNGTDVGLFARTSDEVLGTRLGVALHHSIVWATCGATNDFTPIDLPDADDVGPKWLKVHWKPTTPQANSTSEPTDQEFAWMYRGYLVPLNHNGNIPACG